MSVVIKETRDSLRQCIMESLGRGIANGQLPEEMIGAFNIEVPADRLHGDFATNAAMASARAFKLPPRKIAEIICENIDFSGTYFEKCEIAGPGFINFFLNDKFYAAVLQDIKKCGDIYGESDYGKNKKVMVEFVSANPTGKMHMGNARGGALGDCLVSVLKKAGYDAYSEFYVNDAGNQIEKFGLSLDIRYQQHFKGENAPEMPEDSYHGQDIIERVEEFIEINGDKYLDSSESDRRKALIGYALPKNIEKMQNDLKKYRIVYDTWFYESSLYKSGELEETIQIMKDKGLTYEKDGALWYRATDFGGEKDEVLIRANGNSTYFAADIAYHRNKFLKRNFERVIDVWGADHHGHVARMKGAMNAIGLDGSKLDVVLMQLVRLMSNGVPVKMSKRTGKAITLDNLLDDIPTDAARYFFNMRESGSQMDFDLDLAVEQSSQNPVYYVQYAHARIDSILRRLEDEGITARDCTDDELCLLKTPEERELIRHLGSLTDEIIQSAKNYDPSRMTRYVYELATLFHKFYNSCKVKGEEEHLMQARIQLCIAVKDTIKNVLDMLKITAPSRM